MKRLDPYDVLGVKRDADPETIKQAYRRQAKAHHPDAGGDAARFAESTLAYDVLMDAARRKKFDETGRIDDEPADALENAAKQMLFEMLAHALMGEIDPNSVNLAHQMELNIQKGIEELRGKGDALHRAKVRAERMEKRFVRKAKKENENIFADMLKRHQQQIAEGIEFNAKQIDIRAKALDILRLYSFTMDGMNNFTIRYAPTGGSGFGGLFGGGTMA